MGSSDYAAPYIHMVHHLIEECIVLKMSKDECMVSLSKHANIHPIITSTVWNELVKENKGFFDDYEKRRVGSGSEMRETSRRPIMPTQEDSRSDSHPHDRPNTTN